MNNFHAEIQQRIAEADTEHLNTYIDMFDRFLLYTLAVNSLPKEVISNLVFNWEQAVKSTIDTESQKRTHFLESTPQGRLAKKQKQPDGEDLRLLFLQTLDTAKIILNANLQKPEQEDEDDDELNFDPVND